ncbi:QueT transporter family protein [Streptococcus porcinus]|uniref:QueT transporter family protein n=1 Tax=Streptococcus porcinus TaxID=1340 RepID=UPI0010FE0E46|nr:QueT transporter family protein [Streptococcus porcinus]
MKSYTTRDYVHISLVTALYVVLTITPPLNAISYGAYQFRVAEMLNFLAFFNKKYIVAVTMGCIIANFYSFGLIDVLVGGTSTLAFVTLGVVLFEKYKNDYIFNGLLNKAFLYFSLFFAASMITVAIELVFVAKLPFFMTWFTTAVGEFTSLIIGALIINQLARRIDLSQ